MAPSATVGGLAEGAAPVSTAGLSAQERGEDLGPGVEYGPPTDVDVELGYPAVHIIKYWREKERDPARVMRYDPSAAYIPVRARYLAHERGYCCVHRGSNLQQLGRLRRQF